MTRTAFGGYDTPQPAPDPRDGISSYLGQALYDTFGAAELAALYAAATSTATAAAAVCHASGEHAHAHLATGPWAELAEALADAHTASSKPKPQRRPLTPAGPPVPYSVYPSNDPDAPPIEVTIVATDGTRRRDTVIDPRPGETVEIPVIGEPVYLQAVDATPAGEGGPV